jgi:hypothetical protein
MFSFAVSSILPGSNSMMISDPPKQKYPNLLPSYCFNNMINHSDGKGILRKFIQAQIMPFGEPPYARL